MDELQRATQNSADPGLLVLKRSLDESMQQVEQSRRQLHQDNKGSLLGVHQEVQYQLLREAEKTIRRVQSIPHFLSLRGLSVRDDGTFQSSAWVHVILFPICFDVNV